MRPPGEKLQDKVRKRRPENKEADKRRQGTAEAKRLQRERQKTDKYRAGAATRLARSRDIASKKAVRVHTEKFHANRTSETVYEGGTWQHASQVIADIEGRARQELPTDHHDLLVDEQVLQPVATRGGGRGGIRGMKRKKVQNLCGHWVYAEEGEIADDAKPL